MFRKHGVPHKVVSDQGPQFVSQFMKEFYAMIGVKANLSTAFHPQTDGQTEQVNQEIEVYLRAYVDHLQDDWAEWLSTAEFALNNHEHSVTRQMPFFCALCSAPLLDSVLSSFRPFRLSFWYLLSSSPCSGNQWEGTHDP